MSKHRTSYRRCANGSKGFCTSFLLFDKFGLDNCKIELVEVFPCNSKEELRKREGYWIKHEECVNKVVAGRTYIEYYNENKDKILAKNSTYKKLDKYKEQQKGYREATKQEKQEYDKSYREINQEIIKVRRQEKMTCSVGGSCFRKADTARHEKSQKHLAALEQ